MSYKIPLFDLNFDHEEEAAVLETLRSRWISTGPKTKEFEELFAEMCGVPYAIALSNCTVSLHLSLLTCGIQQGDEVICPSLTFVATVNAIRYCGARPVFCDITGLDNLNMDPTMAESLITPKTKAIILLHYGGFACDMERFKGLCSKHNLKLIEDACHGPLSEYKGKKLGTIGDVGCFSFFSNKNISTGEGGMLVTNDPSINKKARLIRSHGMTSMSYDRSKGHSTAYDVIELGYNYRMDDIRSSIGIVQLRKLKKDLEKRKNVRALYEKHLQTLEQITIPFFGNSEFSSNYIFPIVLKNDILIKRDEVRNRLHENGIQTSVHYPPVHLFSIYLDAGVRLPVTEYIGEHLITLPMYGSMSEDQIIYIAGKLNAALL